MNAEFLRTDEPVVLQADSSASPCSTCAYWFRWLPNTGDCLFYAMQRHAALELGATSVEVPPKSARITDSDETCTGWTNAADTSPSR